MAEPVVVVGAGPAGLAVAAELRRRAVPAVVIDKAPDVGASWRGHYDRLHLHTIRWLSGLPGYPMPRRYGPWVSRAHVVEYLEDYAAHHQLDLRLGTAVEGLEPEGSGWLAYTSDGALTAPAVVVATGYNHTPRLPAWPGRETFRGKLTHAAGYRNGQPYRGRTVLVVGAGNTGAEIAIDLVEHGAELVWLAVRTPPHVIQRRTGGVPSTLISVLTRRLPSVMADPIAALTSRLTVGDLSRFGLHRPQTGLYRRVREEGQIPIIDVGLIKVLKAGQVAVVPAVTEFEGDSVILANDTRIVPDAVIVATGYDRGLGSLVGHLRVLDESGRPVTQGRHCPPGAPGLYFTGYTNPISGMFRELRIDARRIARSISKQPQVRHPERAAVAPDRPARRIRRGA